jgi:magnesium-transporting ATPase (P-type)
MSQWHSQEPQEIIRQLGANPDKGLTEQEAEQRLSRYGKNSLVQAREISVKK